MTSQRYHRAPSSQAPSEGRNQAQLSTVRITMLTSAPRKSRNSLVHVWAAHSATATSSQSMSSNAAGISPTAYVSAVCSSSHGTGSVSSAGSATSDGVSSRQAPTSGAARSVGSPPPQAVSQDRDS